MIVSIMQPAYLPWLGYFDRIAKSDLHIVLDNVALERSSRTRFTNRNKIRTHTGYMWLTVPVRTAGLDQPLIREVVINHETRWAKKHLGSINHCYSKTPFYPEYQYFFESLYEEDWEQLNGLLNYSTAYLLKALRIDTPVQYASGMDVSGEKSDLILNLCQAVGGKTYISGPFGRDYLNLAAFDEAGVKVEFHDYAHPSYQQAYPGFEPHMSVIDLLLNHGEASLVILKNGRSAQHFLNG